MRRLQLLQLQIILRKHLPSAFYVFAHFTLIAAVCGRFLKQRSTQSKKKRRKSNCTLLFSHVNKMDTQRKKKKINQYLNVQKVLALHLEIVIQCHSAFQISENSCRIYFRKKKIFQFQTYFILATSFLTFCFQSIKDTGVLNSLDNVSYLTAYHFPLGL